MSPLCPQTWTVPPGQLRGNLVSAGPREPQSQADSSAQYRNRKGQRAGERAGSHFRRSLAKFQLADLPGITAGHAFCIAIHCPLELRSGLLWFLYLVALKKSITSFLSGDGIIEPAKAKLWIIPMCLNHYQPTKIRHNESSWYLLTARKSTRKKPWTLHQPMNTDSG